MEHYRGALPPVIRDDTAVTILAKQLEDDIQKLCVEFTRDFGIKVEGIHLYPRADTYDVYVDIERERNDKA